MLSTTRIPLHHRSAHHDAVECSPNFALIALDTFSPFCTGICVFMTTSSGSALYKPLTNRLLREASHLASAAFCSCTTSTEAVANLSLQEDCFGSNLHPLIQTSQKGARRSLPCWSTGRGPRRTPAGAPEARCSLTVPAQLMSRQLYGVSVAPSYAEAVTKVPDTVG